MGELLKPTHSTIVGYLAVIPSFFWAVPLDAPLEPESFACTAATWLERPSVAAS